jgi:hypothetical protein
MILLPSAHPALDKIFIPQACLQDNVLLEMLHMFVPSLCWFLSRRRIFSNRTRGFGVTQSISFSLACVCTLNKHLAYLCISLIFFWRQLEFDLPKSGRIVSACALIHNSVIGNSRDIVQILPKNKGRISGDMRKRHSEDG